MKGPFLLLFILFVFCQDLSCEESLPGQIGIRVEVREERETWECNYCKSLFKSGNIRRDAPIVVENLLIGHLRRMGYIPKDCDYSLPCLLLIIYRFEERIGGDYSVEKPASVGFHMHLIEKGSSLATYNFEEEQKPLLSNILAIGKFLRRKGKWVDASTLAEEGIIEGLRKLLEEKTKE